MCFSAVSYSKTKQINKFSLCKLCRVIPRLAGLPENTVTVATAETCLVVESLVGDDLFHFIHSFTTLNTHVLHHCSGSSLSTDAYS